MSDRNANINNALHWLAFHLEVIDEINKVMQAGGLTQEQGRIAREMSARSNAAYKEQRRLLLQRYNVPLSEVRSKLPAFRANRSSAAATAVSDKLGTRSRRNSGNQQNNNNNSNEGLRTALNTVVGIVNARIQGKEHEKKLREKKKTIPLGYGAFFEIAAKVRYRFRFHNARLHNGAYMGMNPAASSKVAFTAGLVGSFNLGFGISGVPGFDLLPSAAASELQKALQVVGKVEGAIAFNAQVPMGIGVFGNASNPKIAFKMQASGDLAIGSLKFKLEFPNWTSVVVGLAYEFLLSSDSKWSRFNHILEYKFTNGFQVLTATTPIVLLTSPSLNQFTSNPLDFSIESGGGDFTFAPHPSLVNFYTRVRQDFSSGIQKFGRRVQETAMDAVNSMPPVQFFNWASSNLF